MGYPDNQQFPNENSLAEEKPTREVIDTYRSGIAAASAGAVVGSTVGVVVGPVGAIVGASVGSVAAVIAVAAILVSKHRHHAPSVPETSKSD
jgi:hypothetical protein